MNSRLTRPPGLSILEFGVVPLAAGPITTQWDGSPQTLQPGESVQMPQAPAGSAIFTAENLATLNNAGAVQITCGPPPPTSLNVDPETKSFLIRNWNAQPFTAANISPQAQTPMQVQLLGQGLAPKPALLPVGGTPVSLASGACCQGPVPPRVLQLVLQSTSGDRSIVAMVGGPRDGAGNNAFVFGLNWDTNSGPGSPSTPPPGFYQTTMTNTIQYQVTWANGGTMFCANLSSAYANLSTPLTVGLRQL